MLRNVQEFRQLGPYSQELKREQPGWARVSQNERDDRYYVELVTKSDNPRVPEQGVKDRSKSEDPRSYFGIVRAVLSDSVESPKDELRLFQRLFESGSPRNAEEVGARYGEIARGAVDAWTSGRATDEDARWLDWFVRVGLLNNAPAASPRLHELMTEDRAAE